MKYSVAVQHAKENLETMKNNADNSMLKYIFLRYSHAYNNKKRIFPLESPYSSSSIDSLCASF